MGRFDLRGVAAALLVVAGATGAVAQELPTAPPESVGLSAAGLAQINEAMRRHLDAGTIANAVTLVMRRGKVVHYEAHGYLDPSARTPMPRDAIFRMASSTKPVTTVALLGLVEDGRIRLDDPVSRYIPSFTDTKVAVPKPGSAAPPPLPPGAPVPAGPPPAADLVPSTRPITIRDLLTHTSGLLSGGLGTRLSTAERGPTDTLADFVPELGQVPLDFQPGTRWSYSAVGGFDTLGRIIEIVSGQPLDAYLRQRIFEPLKMTDTGFVVPASGRSRMNSLYRRNPQGQWQASPPPPSFASDIYFSGAGGLVSTARDYARFEQMLLNGGELDGKRILKPASVQMMRTDQVPGLFNGMMGGEEGMGFGYGVAVTLDSTKARWPRSNGSAGWYGAFGTMSWNDPKEQIVGVIMLQQSAGPVQVDFGNAIMRAILPAQ
jgi:CubicO group peptidase (beta-lactamase class C family)